MARTFDAALVPATLAAGTLTAESDAVLGRTISLAAALSFLLTACSGRIDDAAPGIELGVVEARWTIEQTTDPARCAQYGATRMRFVVRDFVDVVRGTALVPCEEFRATVDLRAGLYRATATFLDATGAPASATLAVSELTVSGDEVVVVPLDFTSDLMDVRQKRQAGSDGA